MNSIHEIRFPGETSEYRTKRNELLKAEIALRDQIEAVAKMRREMPLGAETRKDYIFEELIDGQPVQTSLTDLFTDGKKALAIYSFMYGPDDKNPCPMCTSFLDGMNGNIPHLQQNVNFVVVAKSPIARVVQWAENRKWDRLRILSSHNNTYNEDYFGENEKGQQLPSCNIFYRVNGKVHHFYHSELLFAPAPGNPRHMDLMWPIWNVMDLTREGRGDWYPALEYS